MGPRDSSNISEKRKTSTQLGCKVQNVQPVAQSYKTMLSWLQTDLCQHFVSLKGGKLTVQPSHYKTPTQDSPLSSWLLRQKRLELLMKHVEAYKLMELSNTGTTTSITLSLATDCVTMCNICSTTAATELDATISGLALMQTFNTH